MVSKHGFKCAFPFFKLVSVLPNVFIISKAHDFNFQRLFQTLLNCFIFKAVVFQVYFNFLDVYMFLLIISLAKRMFQTICFQQQFSYFQFSNFSHTETAICFMFQISVQKIVSIHLLDFEEAIDGRGASVRNE